MLAGKRRHLFFIGVILYVCCVFFQTQACAQERIYQYNVRAVLAKDGVLTVTESIVVNAEHDQIRRGITRTFPIKYKTADDSLEHYSFDIVSVKCDGKESPYLESESGYFAGIAIGDSDVFLPRGVHRYDITYKSVGHVRNLADRQELYFNALGLDIAFPVDNASFTLTLPAGANIVDATAYVGREGSRESAYTKTGDTAFATTRTLAPGEAFTVVVSWQRGLVDASNSFANWVGARRILLMGLCMLLLTGLLVTIWNALYRRKQDIIIPRFHAPEGISPAMASMIYNNSQSLDADGMQADIVWTATEGFCHMDLRDPDNVILTRTEPAIERTGWAYSMARQVRDSILPGESLSLKDDVQALAQAYSKLDIECRTRRRLYFSAAPLYPLLAMGLALGFLALLMQYIYHIGLDIECDTIETLCVMGAPFVVCAGFLYMGWRSWKQKRSVLSGIFSSGILLFMAVGMLGGSGLLVGLDVPFFMCLGYILLAPLLFMMCFSVRYTSLGREVLNELHGLEMYIRTAEKERLEFLNAPSDTIETYEEILPYAMALDCVDIWDERFAPLFANIHYEPAWSTPAVGMPYYSGINAFTHSAPMNSAITSAIAKTMATRAAANRRFSQSSGRMSSGSFGGSAGRGSGGGGVGGW